MAWEPSQRPETSEGVTDRWLARCAIYEAYRYQKGEIALEALSVTFNVVSQELWEIDEEDQERLHDIWADLEACYADAGDRQDDSEIDREEVDRLIREFTDLLTPIAAGDGSHDEEV